MLKIVVGNYIQRGQGFTDQRKRTAYMSIFDASMLMFAVDDPVDYRDIFKNYGVNKDTVDACGNEAMNRVNKFIDSLK